MARQRNADNANGAPLPAVTVRGVTFQDGTMEDVCAIKLYNGASRAPAGFVDNGVVPGFRLDPQGAGHNCFWRNVSTQWALNRFNNPPGAPFNYVDRVCQQNRIRCSMKIQFYVGVLSLWASSLFSAVPKEVFDYLRPILKHELTAAGDAWSYSGNGGYVLRFDLDVTGDRDTEMFLISTLDFQKLQGRWNVYKAVPGGTFEPYEGQVSLSPTGFWLENRGGGKVIVTSFHDRWSDQEKREILRKDSFAGDKITSESSRFMDDPLRELETQGAIKKYVPEVWGILLADLLRDSNTEWRRMNFESPTPSPSNYFIAAEDSDKVKGLANFTPDLAMKWLEAATAGKQPTETISTAPLRPSPGQTATGTISSLTRAQAQQSAHRKTPNMAVACWDRRSDRDNGVGFEKRGGQWVNIQI